MRYLSQPRVALLGGDGREGASVRDAQRGHGGDRKGYLRGWHHHAELGQLHPVVWGIASQERLSHMLNVVLENRK